MFLGHCNCSNSSCSFLQCVFRGYFVAFWLFSLWPFTLHAESEVEIFADFLELNQLSRAVVVLQQEAASNGYSSKQQHIVASKDLYQLWGRTSLSVYNVAAAGGNVNFQQQFHFRSPRVGVFVPHLLSDAVHLQVLQPASEGNFFSFRQTWLLMSPEIDAARAILEQYNINIDADITLGIRLENNTVLLYDVSKICHRCGSALSILYKGSWSSRAGFQLVPELRNSFVRRRADFQGLPLKSSTAIMEKPANLSFLEHLENDVNDKQLDLMQRKTFQLLKLLEPAFNFSFDIRFMDTWGRFTGDSWNGVIGELVSGRAEVAVCPLRYTRERISAIHFTPDLHTEIIRFLFRHPRRNGIRNIFLEPFEDSVWWGVFSLLVGSILLLRLLIQQENRRHSLPPPPLHPPPPSSPTNHRFTNSSVNSTDIRCRVSPPPELQRVDFSVLVILTAIFMQGPSPDTFNSMPSRTLVTTVCVFGFMLLQFYGAFIVSSLLSVAPRTITTLPALYNSTLAIGMENISYNFEFFGGQSPNAIARDIYAQRICKNPRRNILPMREGVKRIRDGGYAFHTSVGRAYRSLQHLLTDREFCDLQEVAMEPPFHSSAATTRDSPFREHLANGILRLRLSGLMQYNEKKWLVKKPDCALIQRTEDVSVDIEHFGPALVFLGLAMLGTISVLFIELAIKWYREKKMKQREAKRRRDKKEERNRRKLVMTNIKI